MNKLYVFENQTPDCGYDLVIAISFEKAIEYHNTEKKPYELMYFKDQTYITYHPDRVGWEYQIVEYTIKEGIL